MVAWGGGQQPSGSLVDVLDRVLDKGLVVAGDIRISLADVELLTIKIRLLICSVDKAQEIGVDWWRQDGYFSGEAERQTAELQARIEALEQQVALATQPRAAPSPPARSRPRTGRRRQED